MRRKLIIGNWKMNNGPQEGRSFLIELEKKLKNKEVNVDFAIAAPFVTLPFMLGISESENEEEFYLPLVAQNFYAEKNANVTGEISLEMIDQLGIDYVLIGHSERRNLFGETDEDVNRKLHSVVPTEMIPIVAFGENEEQYKANKTKEVLKEQITKALKDIDEEDVINIVFAYEPQWAIGSGVTPTPKEAQEVIKYSRSVIADLYHDDVAQEVIFQYGGSVSNENIADFMNQPDIDGALVGRSSFKVDSFIELLTYDTKK